VWLLERVSSTIFVFPFLYLITMCASMEAPNISYTFWGGPFLDGLDFLRVHLDSISINYKPNKTILSTQKVHFYILA